MNYVTFKLKADAEGEPGEVTEAKPGTFTMEEYPAPPQMVRYVQYWNCPGYEQGERRAE